jgi:hypothetical protein
MGNLCSLIQNTFTYNKSFNRSSRSTSQGMTAIRPTQTTNVSRDLVMYDSATPTLAQVNVPYHCRFWIKPTRNPALGYSVLMTQLTASGEIKSDQLFTLKLMFPAAGSVKTDQHLTLWITRGCCEPARIHFLFMLWLKTALWLSKRGPSIQGARSTLSLHLLSTSPLWRPNFRNSQVQICESIFSSLH